MFITFRLHPANPLAQIKTKTNFVVEILLRNTITGQNTFFANDYICNESIITQVLLLRTHYD